MFTPSGFKDQGIRKIYFVVKTPLRTFLQHFLRVYRFKYVPSLFLHNFLRGCRLQYVPSLFLHNFLRGCRLQYVLSLFLQNFLRGYQLQYVPSLFLQNFFRGSWLQYVPSLFLQNFLRDLVSYNTFHLYFYKTFLEVTGYNMFSSLFLQNFSWKVTSSNTIRLYFYKTFLETLSVTIRSVSIFTKFFLEGNWFQYIPSLIFTKFSWKLTGSNMFRLYNSYVRLFNLLSFSWHRIYLSVFLIPVCLTLNFYAGFYS